MKIIINRKYRKIHKTIVGQNHYFYKSCLNVQGENRCLGTRSRQCTYRVSLSCLHNILYWSKAVELHRGIWIHYIEPYMIHWYCPSVPQYTRYMCVRSLPSKVYKVICLQDTSLRVNATLYVCLLCIQIYRITIYLQHILLEYTIDGTFSRRFTTARVHC